MVELNLDIMNPYSIGTLVELNSEETILVRERLNYKRNKSDKLHTTKEDENIFSISYQYYGDSRWYWVIWDVNPEIETPFNLAPNLDILIPDLDIIKASLL